jgi:hypothetical protein
VLLPAWFGIIHPRFRAVTILTALLLTAGVAIAPGAISQTGGGRYAANLGSQDFAQTGFAKPESIEFIGADEWGVFEHSFWRSSGSKTVQLSLTAGPAARRSFRL